MNEAETRRLAIGLMHTMTRIAEALANLNAAQTIVTEAVLRLSAGERLDPAALRTHQEHMQAAQFAIRGLAKELEAAIDLLEAAPRG
jgi:Zn-dependent peptidase ImmA (M78 family)